MFFVDTDTDRDRVRERERERERVRERQCGDMNEGSVVKAVLKEVRILEFDEVYPSILSGSAPENRSQQEPGVQGACPET